MKLAYVCFLLSLSIIITATSYADIPFRCRGGLIETGDTVPEVVNDCGEPIFINRPGSVVIQIGGVLWPIAVDEEWIYNLGPHQFIRFVRFRGGRVVDIGHGNYGWTD